MRFIIISTCYNVAKWIPINVAMVKYQSYHDFLCVYVDDNSKDNTFEILKRETHEDNRFVILQNPDSGSQGAAYMYAYDWINTNALAGKNDVIVEIDGDDWLSSVFVLDYLYEIYKNSNIWMTCGQYQIYPTMGLGGHYNMYFDDSIDKENTYKKHPFPYSHLKTYRKFLLDKIDRHDLIDKETGKIFKFAWDHALCIPMVEMAGKDRIYVCRDVLYVLNRASELQNEGKCSLTEQKQVEARIRGGRVYDRT